VKISKVGVLALLLALGALAVCAYGIQMLHEQRAELAELRQKIADVGPAVDKFKGAVRDMGRDLASLVMDEIDLTKTGWQPIGRGFFVIDVGAERQADGLKLRGKVINTSALTHEALLFRARVGAGSATFTVPKAASGIAIPFEVVVSDVPASAPLKGFLTLETSTIAFASSSSKSPAAREPIDPDKLLR
jgi:hypothetical protein